jgi:hypothetical protein
MDKISSIVIEFESRLYYTLKVKGIVLSIPMMLYLVHSSFRPRGTNVSSTKQKISVAHK